MARRPEGNGKKKRKSVKAKMTSKFGSKRKLSRMGKRVKEVRFSYSIVLYQLLDANLRLL